ncbi:MAG TPA: type II toxin-antitoxin system VapC family toxin [Gemmatimonadales bacterium]|nr:type II toxin-antitoxin system VapC family toxin [Gemmatimonadales bacterium]
MPVVVDTSVLIAVIAAEAERPALIRLTKGAELVAPASVHWEIGNACSAMLKRRRASLAQVRAMLTAYAKIPIRFLEVDLAPALEIADAFGLYAYDAYLLATARAQRAPLLTLDQSLARAAREAGLTLLEVPG